MKFNPKNDVYHGDLEILNKRKQEWGKGNPGAAKFRILTYIILIVGVCAMIYVAMHYKGGDTMLSQLPLHLTIWITALLAYLTMRHARRTSEDPFYGYHSARFEADNNTIYYIYQQGMALKTYAIKDWDIETIIRDDDAGALYIKGPGSITTQKRKSESSTDVPEFYALVPFDKYDLDDLLKPYKKVVKRGNGTLRAKYLESN